MGGGGRVERAGSPQNGLLCSCKPCPSEQAALLSSVLLITSWFLYSGHGPAYVYRTSIGRPLRRRTTAGQSPDTSPLPSPPCPPGYPPPHASYLFHLFPLSCHLQQQLPAFLPPPSFLIPLSLSSLSLSHVLTSFWPFLPKVSSADWLDAHISLSAGVAPGGPTSEPLRTFITSVLRSQWLLGWFWAKS